MQISSLISTTHAAATAYRAARKPVAMSQEVDATPAANSASAKFDFTHMTPRQMQAAMGELISSGRMSFDESSSLATLIPSPLSKLVPDGQWPASYDQPTNFMATLNSALAGAESRFDTNDAAYIQKSIDALQRLQGTDSSISIGKLTA